MRLVKEQIFYNDFRSGAISFTNRMGMDAIQHLLTLDGGNDAANENKNISPWWWLSSSIPRNHPVNLETWDLLPRNLETRNPVSRYTVNPVIWNPGNPEPGELTTTGRTNKTPMSNHRGFCISWKMAAGWRYR